MSIGLRLTLWYSSVLAAGLALFASAIWIATERSFHASVGENLVERARGVANLIDSEFDESSPGHLQEELSEYTAAAPQGDLISVRDEAGRELLSTKSVVLAWPSRIEGRTFGNVSARPGHYRTLALSETTHGHRFDILVAVPLAGIEDLLRRVRVLLLTMAPIVLLLASLGGYWLSRRVLAPVDEMTSAARLISIQNLSQRLKTPTTKDELQRLSETWNDMLDRLEAAFKRLTQFTADASHELRTPIALIQTTAELTLRRERSAETYREALGQVVVEAERTSRLIEDLLTLARADAGLPSLPMDRLELAPLVREVCRQGSVLAEARHVALTADMPEGPVYVRGNDAALRRLFLVLLDNAIKYTPSGGSVAVSLAADPGGATVEVQDTGVGIEESALPHIFERFYRADPSRNRSEGGSGLGLSIAKWIVESHHAEIQAESEAGRGSVFRVRFPNGA
jgi:heavy metal sensor kinase